MVLSGTPPGVSRRESERDDPRCESGLPDPVGKSRGKQPHAPNRYGRPFARGTMADSLPGHRRTCDPGHSPRREAIAPDVARPHAAISFQPARRTFAGVETTRAEP